MDLNAAYDELGPLAFCPPEDSEPAGAPAPAAADPRGGPAAGGPRPGSRRVPGTGGRDFGYVGVVRLGGRVLVECGHEHTNRDWPDRPGRPGATGCAREIIDGAASPGRAERIATRRADAWTGLVHSAFTHPASTIAAAKTAAAADAVAYLAAVATVRDATTG